MKTRAAVKSLLIGVGIGLVILGTFGAARHETAKRTPHGQEWLEHWDGRLSAANAQELHRAFRDTAASQGAEYDSVTRQYVNQSRRHIQGGEQMAFEEFVRTLSGAGEPMSQSFHTTHAQPATAPYSEWLPVARWTGTKRQRLHWVYPTPGVLEVRIRARFTPRRQFTSNYFEVAMYPAGGAAPVLVDRRTEPGTRILTFDANTPFYLEVSANAAWEVLIEEHHTPETAIPLLRYQQQLAAQHAQAWIAEQAARQYAAAEQRRHLQAAQENWRRAAQRIQRERAVAIENANAAAIRQNLAGR